MPMLPIIPKSDPSPSAIRRACHKIQRGWSAAEERRRRADPHLDSGLTIDQTLELAHWSVPVLPDPTIECPPPMR